MTDRTYNFAGFSNLNGTVKMRFSQSESRVKTLAKNGHTDIAMIAFDTPVSKREAAEYFVNLTEEGQIASTVIDEHNLETVTSDDIAAAARTVLDRETAREQREARRAEKQAQEKTSESQEQQSESQEGEQTEANSNKGSRKKKKQQKEQEQSQEETEPSF